MFGMRHETMFKCSFCGKTNLGPESSPSVLQYHVTELDMKLARSALKVSSTKSISIQDYFACFIPTRPGGSDWLKGTFMHNDVVRCLHGSQGVSTLDNGSVRTIWPQVLQVVPSTRGESAETFDSKTALRFPLTWDLSSAPGMFALITPQPSVRLISDRR